MNDDTAEDSGNSDETPDTNDGSNDNAEDETDSSDNSDDVDDNTNLPIDEPELEIDFPPAPENPQNQTYRCCWALSLLKQPRF